MKLSTDDIGDNVLTYIENIVSATSFGSVVISAHEGRLIQMEIVEKVRFGPDLPQQVLHRTPITRTPLLQGKIRQALGGLKYGQVTLSVKAGKAIQIDRTEKRRLDRAEGLHGDGI
ncbi:MAG: YezD family protein [Negativicutes bacterium]|nr:YezD family protein [Negativicutes bacterium]